MNHFLKKTENKMLRFKMSLMQMKFHLGEINFAQVFGLYMNIIKKLKIVILMVNMHVYMTLPCEKPNLHSPSGLHF